MIWASVTFGIYLVMHCATALVGYRWQCAKR
jgi:hypothetical protein